MSEKNLNLFIKSDPVTVRAEERYEYTVCLVSEPILYVNTSSTMKKNCPGVQYEYVWHDWGLLQIYNFTIQYADSHLIQQLVPDNEKELASCMCGGIRACCKFTILLSSIRTATLHYIVTRS